MTWHRLQSAIFTSNPRCHAVDYDKRSSSAAIENESTVRRLWLPLVGMLLAAMILLVVSCWLGRSYAIEPPWKQIARISRQTNLRGESIAIFFGLAVFDARTGEHRWTAEQPGACNRLVAEHYLAGVREGKVDAVDLDDALAVPITVRGSSKTRDVEWQPFELNIPDLHIAYPNHPDVLAIPGTNCFLVQNPSVSPIGPATVYALEIESRSLRLLAQWTCANMGLFVLPSGQINSVTPDGSVVEVRWAKDFAIERTMPFPAGVRSWQVETRNSLLSYPDPKTQVSRVCRLDDFSPIPELNIPLLRSKYQEVGDDRKYHILSDQHLRASRRLVVYDSVDRQIVYDSGPALGYKHAEIREGQLRLSTVMFGLTTRFVDLKSGQVVRTERPYLWIITAMPLVLLAALVWLTIWIAKIPCSRRLLPLNILFVASLFVVPLVWRTGRAGFHVFGPYPTVEYTHATLLALVFCLAVYAAFGTGRLLLRTIPFLVSMSLLLVVVEAFNLVDFKESGANSMAQIAFRIWVTFGVISLTAVYVMRYLGWRFEWPGQTYLGTASVERSKVHLADFFAVTAFVALATKVFGPQLDLLLHPTAKWFVVGRSAMLVGLALLGLLALVRSAKVYRACVFLAVGISLLAIIDIVLHVSLEMYRKELWYRMASDTRYPVFLMLSSFAFCSMMRAVGIRWKGRNLAAQVDNAPITTRRVSEGKC